MEKLKIFISLITNSYLNKIIQPISYILYTHHRTKIKTEKKYHRFWLIDLIYLKILFFRIISSSNLYHPCPNTIESIRTLAATIEMVVFSAPPQRHLLNVFCSRSRSAVYSSDSQLTIPLTSRLSDTCPLHLVFCFFYWHSLADRRPLWIFAFHFVIRPSEEPKC